ncbi:piwi-like protein Ago3 [Harpegnathos saltator]|uniref:Piwi-like protein 1 n=1 Tax=Harpegnathos saltator TaxID=610380 RepID=E2B9V7_HARSA|nr:piwi-like protein Ago3 [Harpegnathos saltator]EFN87544.1 Piwi-like protein 1 [Harpegnathos saltator]
MTDKKIPIGKGRGSTLLEMMRKREIQEREKQKEQERLAHSIETPSQESSSQTRSFERYSQSSFAESSVHSIGRGRAQLSSLVKSHSSGNESEPKASAAISHGVAKHGSLGRGSLISLLQQRAEASSSSSSSTQAGPSVQQSNNNDGVLGMLADLTVYDNPPELAAAADISPELAAAPVCRQGKCGERVNVFANYIDLEIEPGKGLFQYEVKFSPDIDSRVLRRKLLNQHAAKIGQTRTFDGMILFLPNKLPENIIHCHSEHPVDGSQVALTIIYKKQQSMSENVQFFNVLFGRIMRALSLVRIGRQSFNPKCSHDISQHHLEVWPGYVTAVNEFEGGLKLCLDIKHRVLRTITVRDLMTDLYQRQRHNYQEYVAREIIGTSVLTRYNNRTYRIDDIAWDKTPEYKFSKNGEDISLMNYYKIFCGIEIQDNTQPLLVHRATERTASGERQERILLLIPELSYVAGLTDSIRSNYKMMKDLDAVTKVSPSRRRDEIRLFVKEIKKNEVTRGMLSGWGLRLRDDIVQFNGRSLPPEQIYLGNNKTITQNPSKIGDWTTFVTRNPVLRTPHLNKWYILYVSRDEVVVKEFLKMVQGISRAIGMRVSKPHSFAVRDDRSESYLQEVRRHFNNDYELAVVVFPTNRTDRYSSLKRLCCVEKPIASQVIITKTIANAAKLKSVTEKIMLQINCKLGGALWTVALPLKRSMVCGIDVYHSGVGSGSKQSVAGFVASLDVQLTKWHSKVCMQASKQELTDMLQMCLVSAVNAYRRHNQVLPERIIIYRDGVGDGDLDYVVRYEVRQLIETFNRIEPNYKPQLSVIVVQKRINTRLFIESNGNLGNPEVGTVIDSCITRRNYYDFFLVPQNVRQGSVTPIHYIVIHDTSNMETDHLQRLTYKLCHLYYNWSGTIRIPAPCQYAHKLVYLVGQNIQVEPHHSLNDILYYL